jgi:O-6-methylguanine DNA methyltransferase
MSDFKTKVYEIVRNIPKGSTLSYKEVAVLAGNPLASRAVARLMSMNYDVSIPCHRVIKSDGTVGGYNRGGEEIKRSILTNEKAL